MFRLSKFKTIYSGSVKNLRLKKKPTAKKPGVIVFEFTDDYSIFDYGKMPDTIPGKGAAMAMGSAFIFESISSPKAWKALGTSNVWNKIRIKSLRDNLHNGKLFKRFKREGFPTHYRGLIDPETGETLPLKKLKKPSNLLEVDAVRIIHPEPVSFSGTRLWNYSHFVPALDNFLVPLECIFRFGVPKGSSLFERIKNPGYLESMGLSNPPKPNDWLSRPVVEYFSKLEPSDRHLGYETALNYSGLGNELFVDLNDTTLLVSLFLMDLFSKVKLTLWDGKFEFLKLNDGIVLGDAITPDELRLTYRGIQISKEPLRQYYHKFEPAFADAMKKAKVIATKKDMSLRDIVNNDLKCPPALLDEEFKQAISNMYLGLTAFISGTKLFGDIPPMSSVLKTFKKFGIV